MCDEDMSFCDLLKFATKSFGRPKRSWKGESTVLRSASTTTTSPSSSLWTWNQKYSCCQFVVITDYDWKFCLGHDWEVGAVVGTYAFHDWRRNSDEERHGCVEVPDQVFGEYWNEYVLPEHRVDNGVGCLDAGWQTVELGAVNTQVWSLIIFTIHKKVPPKPSDLW